MPSQKPRTLHTKPMQDHHTMGKRTQEVVNGRIQLVQGELSRKRNCAIGIVKGLAIKRPSVQALPVKRVEEVMGPQR
jgi:hypothetical protein